MNLHLELKDKLETAYGNGPLISIDLKQDALIAEFDTGVAIELRYLSQEEYSIAWVWGEAEFRIDTAPLHPHLNTYPNHLHDDSGNIVDDPLTSPSKAPWDNVQGLLGVIINKPLVTAT
ncbi:MAG: toxin-antitoxin system TumE family protein [Burkholderiales bacterium]